MTSEGILVSLHTKWYFSRRLQPVNCIVWSTGNILLYSLFFVNDSYRRCDITFLIVSQGTVEASHFQVYFQKLPFSEQDAFEGCIFYLSIYRSLLYFTCAALKDIAL